MDMPCGPRAMTTGGGDVDADISIMVPEAMSPAYLYGVLAHEVGHVIYWATGATFRRRGMVEGLASWAAGDYWLAWHGHSSL